MQLARDQGIKTSERKITIDEVFQAQEDGSLKEIFSTGTAAVISPVGALSYRDQIISINNGETGELSKLLFNELQALQRGQREDKHNWLVRVG